MDRTSLPNGVPLVSVVTPMFNAANHIALAYDSLATQACQDWEWLVVDDASTDGGPALVTDLADRDPRVRLVSAPKNVGAGVARNLGIESSRGRLIAFLDADDVWRPFKLDTQLAYMQTTQAYFTFTGFWYMPSSGQMDGTVVHVPHELTYREALKNTTILTSTVMIDTLRVTKDQLRFPDLRRGQDTALWWHLLRTVGPAVGLDESLTGYRQNPDSLSANRVKALKRTWALYRDVEGIPLGRSAWYFAHYVLRATARRRGRITVRFS